MDDVSKQNTFTFVLPERLNAQTQYGIVGELKGLPDNDCDCVVIDMSHTVFIDSSGIGVFVYLYREFTAKSKPLILKRPRKSIYDLFMEIGIGKLFDMDLATGFKKAETSRTDIETLLKIDEETIDDVAVLTLRGVMNYPASSAAFRKNMLLALASNGKILLDFKNLAFFDSLSVGLVLRVSELLSKSGGAMRICGASRTVSSVFENLGISTLIPFFKTREDALANWQ